MNCRTLPILLIGACLATWSAPPLAEARGGGGGRSFSRGGGSFGSIRNSSGSSTRDVSRPSGSDYARPSTGAISTPSQGQVSDRLPSQPSVSGGERPSQKTAPSRLPAGGSGLTATQQPAGQREALRQRAENLTPEQKQELRQKYENSGLKPSQLPSEPSREDWEERRDEIREDWQAHRDEIREDWQNWYHDMYNDYWDDHWYGYWWVGYPVTVVSYSFYIDDTPPCQKTVVVNQSGTSTTYYYCSSMWYQPVYTSGDVKYVVTSPPPGAELTSLSDPKKMTVGGQDFYLSNHVFYQKITRDGKTLYVTVDAPVGAKVPTIPEYAVEIQHEGKTYYRFDRIFYQREGDSFLVVKNPGV